MNDAAQPTSSDAAATDRLADASPTQLRAEIARLRQELADLHLLLAQERQARQLASARDSAAVVYDLSDKARQDLAREIWLERQKWTFGYKLSAWLRRRFGG